MKKKWVSAVLAATLLAGTTIMIQPQPVQAYSETSVIVDKTLLSKLTSMLDTDKQNVILTYKSKPTTDDLNLLKSLGITAGQTFNELPMIVLPLGKLQLQTLLGATLPNVVSIYSDKELKYFMDKSAAQIGAVKNRETVGMGFTGKGVGVAVLDSGIDGTHPDLQFGKRTIQNVKVVDDLLTTDLIKNPVYLENVPDSDNAGGHGTHCAGTIAGDGTASGGLYKGVAPEANLVGISAGATILITSALAGLDYVLAHHEQYNIQVVSNSWGSTGAYDENDPINVATKRLHDAGITVVFAAGNEGPNANTINPYSVAPWVISVAAGNKETGTLADFSSRGIRGDAFYKPTVTAPGVDIISAKAKQSVLAPLSLQTDLKMIPTQYQLNYTTMSGTSMATPHIAGVIALLEQANPNLTPDQTKAILQGTATRMPGYEEFEVGKGYVNAFAAIDKAQHPERTYGAVLNQTFNAQYSGVVNSVEGLNAAWSPLKPASFTFEVKDNAQVSDLLVQWENLANLMTVKVTAPDGTVKSYNANLLGAVYGTQTAIALPTPQKGTWKVEVTGALGTLVGLPDTVQFSYRTYYGTFSGMDDIKGHLYEAAIREAVSKRLIDSVDATRFAPDSLLYKGDLARWIASDFEIRQNLTNSTAYQDVSPFLAPFVAAVTSDAAPMRDIFWKGGNVIAPSSTTNFGVSEVVTRTELAKALVKALGLDALAQQNMNTKTTFIDDASIPADARGYVVVAEQQGLLDGYLNSDNKTYSFKPSEHVTRGAFAYSLLKGYHVFMK